jgi:holo-[acyl-carrier protein] synthase
MEIGVDIVEIDRIRKSVRNSRFLKRIFTPTEVKYCRSHKNAAQHFAVRFAAKEAVWKAVSSDVKLNHREIQIRNLTNGKPEVVFPPRLASLSRRVLVSLSHGREYAVAMVVYNRSALR